MPKPRTTTIKLRLGPDLLKRLDAVVGTVDDLDQEREAAIGRILTGGLALIEASGLVKATASAAESLTNDVYRGGARPFGFDIVAGRLVPNPTEQDQLASMRAMRARGAGYREIGRATGKPPMTVRRIFDRLAG